MIYSVWDPKRRAYTYYQVGEYHNDDGYKPSKRGGGQLGYAPEEVSWKLPANARSVGSGVDPKGAIVHLGDAGSYDFGDKMIWLAFLGILLIREWKK